MGLSLVSARAHGSGLMAALRTALTLVLAGVALGLTALNGCAGRGDKKPVAVQPTIQRDVPQMLRGTVGSMSSFRGIEPVLVSGIGIVVGLNGTGGDLLPDSVKATIEREMGLRGIGTAESDNAPGIAGKSPGELLRDPNIAVVLVQAAIAPGSPDDATFDVAVKALNATSLEGGVLWSTDLRLGYAATFGTVATKIIGRAEGPIFINPFADGVRSTSEVTRTSGRILDGGAVTDPLGIELVLDNQSHTLARSVVSAINSRFPPGPGDRHKTARGRSGESIELRIPGRFRDDPETFLNLIRFLRVDQSIPEETSLSLVEAMQANPEMADVLAWSVEGVGNKSLPFIRKIYDSPETLTRLAALRTGARLGDPVAAQYLADLARNGSQSIQTDAIRLLAKIDAGPKVDLTLKALMSDDDMLVRVAAYEALATRAERAQLGRLASWQASNRDPTAERLKPRHLEVLAKSNLPSGTIQGVRRRLLPGGFFLDVVDSNQPMIYVTQQRQPRIVLFGSSMNLTKPLTMSAWGDRFLLTTQANQSVARIFYMPAKSGRPITTSVDGHVAALVEILARQATGDEPSSGMSMSYSDIVGVLYEMQRAGGVVADFTTESDRLRALLLAAESSLETRERPETAKDREVMILSPKRGVLPTVSDEPATVDVPKIVPIVPPTKGR